MCSLVTRAGVLSAVVLSSVGIVSAQTVSRKQVVTTRPRPASLEDARTVFLVNQVGDEQPFNAIAGDLQRWRRWAIVNQPDTADIIVTLASNSAAQRDSVRPAAARPGVRNSYTLTVRSRVGNTALWRETDPDVGRLFKRRGVDVAPSFCFVIWCR